jgi:ElaB/YqjD/DUF883 family membrane-anchored ribosome-binding protein
MRVARRATMAERDFDMEAGEINHLNGHRHVMPKLVQGVKSADDKVVAFVRERPIAAVCTALAVGYLLGRIFTKIA